MNIKIRGASENNLKSIDCDIGDGLTVITGISGSGKSSLVFDTLYHEARRKFLELFRSGRTSSRMIPANVGSVTGIGPTIGVDQNLLNRNPNSTLASSSGIHPFLRLLFARFGIRHCPDCGEGITILQDDEIVDLVKKSSRTKQTKLTATLVHGAKGSHRTLIDLLKQEFGEKSIIIDGMESSKIQLNQKESHDIEIVLGSYLKPKVREIREAIEFGASLGCSTYSIIGTDITQKISRTNICPHCGIWIKELEPKYFQMKCKDCKGKGCDKCDNSGMHPLASSVHWANHRIDQLLELSVSELPILFKDERLPKTAERLRKEIMIRLDALSSVGLGYLQLNRSAPTLSRGEAQRVRIAISLTSKLEDIVHILDEPTIGQHPSDVEKFLPAFKQLQGPVIYVEHDRVAAAYADTVLDIGPGAGEKGGEITFSGTPAELWKSDTITGQYFSLQERVRSKPEREEPRDFIEIIGAKKHNLRDIDIKIPKGRMTVITGPSGSGKSTLVEHILVPSLKDGKPIGCTKLITQNIKPVLVDQRPIGKNPRSNPATYTKLSDIIRDLYASETGLSGSHFSFNRPEGACKKCNGMGAVEVKMKYLPSLWIKCDECDGKRFNEEVLEARIRFGSKEFSIADIYDQSIEDVNRLINNESRLNGTKKKSATMILDALVTIGLGYVKLGQPSPSLSGGESQRVKLAKYLGKRNLQSSLLILDEPSTGLHPADLDGLLSVLHNLVDSNATIVIVEHNSDMIRSAHWIVDLGPGGGPEGGEAIYQGPLNGLLKENPSLTSKALLAEEKLNPNESKSLSRIASESISIKNARANNLRGVTVDIPKRKITVVTGLSGSGKSSLVRDVLQAEAERRYYESLSLYERQGTSEGPEAPVDSVTGLGVAIAISSRRHPGSGWWAVYATRSTVGTATEIDNHLSILFSRIGERECDNCGTLMQNNNGWVCSNCETRYPPLRPRDFSPRTYTSACNRCSGVGHFQEPVPSKLIIDGEKPICGGAMFSPGYFPKGYFCQPTSWAAGALDALGERYGFDSRTTIWNDITEDAKSAFLYGDPNPDPLEITYLGTRRGERVEVTGKGRWAGFYYWVKDWDVGGTYTKRVLCSECNGSGLKPHLLTIKLVGHSIHELKQYGLEKLEHILSDKKKDFQDSMAEQSYRVLLQKLRFLNNVGLNYLNLARQSTTLSAGEAQRVILASLLGSGLTALTVLLDEPSRGMHPSEIDNLVDAIKELRNEGHTVVIVEHDPSIIKKADYIVDMGPLHGVKGGHIVAEGTLEEIEKAETITGYWLSGKRTTEISRTRRTPIAWMTIEGARENNLKDITVEIPLGLLVGICGKSGSGKSTLMLDTIGRALAPVKFSTSVSYVPVDPGEYESIKGAPTRVVLLDQGRKGIRNPGNALDLFKPLARLYAEGEDANALEINDKELLASCDVCNGAGQTRTELGFLPDVYSECEVCKGSGRKEESWEVQLHGIPFPRLNELTLEELFSTFGYDDEIARRLKPAIDVGLGYLVLKQPSVSLSGGEIQRLKIAQELMKKTDAGTLYILDEPTVGQHLEDVERLIGVLHELVAAGNSVVVIEHHTNILAACDWLIELGPRGGPEGGELVASGTPEDIAKSNSPTSSYIREVLEVNK